MQLTYNTYVLSKSRGDIHFIRKLIHPYALKQTQWAPLAMPNKIHFKLTCELWEGNSVITPHIFLKSVEVLQYSLLLGEVSEKSWDLCYPSVPMEFLQWDFSKADRAEGFL